MINTGLSFDKILRTLIPGIVLIFASQETFYVIRYGQDGIYKLFEVFDNVDTTIITLYLILSLLLGTIINLLADVIVSSNYIHESSSKRKKITFSFWQILLFPTNMKPLKDPRVQAIKDYIENSPRTKLFQRMISESYGHELKNDVSDRDLVILHQHLVTRSKLISQISKTYSENEYNLVIFISSLTLVSVACLLLSFVLLVMSAYGVIEIQWVLFAYSILFFYLITLFCNELLKRQFKRFSRYIVTLNINQFSISK